MEETSKNQETAQLGIGAVSTRYFFVCTMGKRFEVVELSIPGKPE